jgi:hypoxanthine-guanine phosphoribosyltransferase
MITEEEIQTKVRELARELDELYRDEPPLMVGGIDRCGGVHDRPDEGDVGPGDARLHGGVELRGEHEIVGRGADLEGPERGRRGRRLLVVEDIVDSGLTLQYLLDVLRRRNPADIRVVALLRKEKEGAAEVQVDRVGFSIPDEFVVGYGLDYAGTVTVTCRTSRCWTNGPSRAAEGRCYTLRAPANPGFRAHLPGCEAGGRFLDGRF